MRAINYLKVWLPLIVLMVVSLASTITAEVKYKITPIAISGQQAPGQVGTFTDVGLAVLNSDGRVAFVGNKISSYYGFAGIYYAEDSKVFCIADTSTPLPQDPCESFYGCSQPFINDNGTIVFSANSGWGCLGEGVYSGGSGPLTRIASSHTNNEPGTPVPGESKWYFLEAAVGAINNFDEVVFYGKGGPASKGIYVYIGRTSEMLKIVDCNTPVPGQPGAIFDRSHPECFNWPTINSVGDLTFWATYTGGEGSEGLYIHTSGILQRIADGTIIPPGKNYPFQRFGIFSMNSLTHVAFAASGYYEPPYALCYLWANDQLQFLGDPKGNLEATGHPYINDSDTAVIVLYLDQYHNQIWRVASGLSELVVDTGDPVPGVEDRYFTSGSISLTQPLINNNGEVAFLASWESGDYPPDYGRGIYTDVGGCLVKVVDTEDILVDGLSAVIIYLATTGHNNSSGLSVFNDNGQVAFSAELSDGRQGVFLASPVFIPDNGDFNGDEIVDFADFALLVSYWQYKRCNSRNCRCQQTDCEPDGDVDLIDLAHFAGYWLEQTTP